MVMLTISDLTTTLYSVWLMLERGLCLSISVHRTWGQVEQISTNIAVGHLFEMTSGAPLGFKACRSRCGGEQTPMTRLC